MPPKATTKKAPVKKVEKKAPTKKAPVKKVEKKAPAKKVEKTKKDDKVCTDSISSIVANVKPWEDKFGQRMFGDYKCTKCDQEWKSHRSYKDRYQKCMKCRTEVFPTNLVPIIRKEQQ